MRKISSTILVLALLVLSACSSDQWRAYNRATTEDEKNAIAAQGWNDFMGQGTGGGPLTSDQIMRIMVSTTCSKGESTLAISQCADPPVAHVSYYTNNAANVTLLQGGSCHYDGMLHTVVCN